MYLQSLEMIGFKSFAPRTVLHFHRGVTAVVGPNGCGKSNVLDAIRWVLGEQSAKALRGGEMADVIFSGTDSRPALGMAEVSLTFADCEKELGVEWNEVRITRRVYRDGKSEYFLNKTPCRLRDIHELFMDTGVGRSAYSIMEQGKIDLILSSRPEDRRAIFEEAAGITKYKAQKKEALRKLEYTEANLLRVQDIIKEVRRQIGSLQRQAAKARRYKSLMADLRTLDAHLSRKLYDDMGAELESLRAGIAGLDEARAVHERETSEQEAELLDFRARVAAKEEEITASREEVQELRNRIFSAENRLATNSERIEEARSLTARHEADIATASEKIQVQRGEIEETERQIAAMLEILKEQEAELSAREARLLEARSARSGAESRIAGLATDFSRTESRLAALRASLSAAAGRREAGETRLRLIQGEQAAAQSAAAELGQRLEALSARVAVCRQELEAAQAGQADALRAVEAAQRQRQEAEHAHNLAAKEAASLESRAEVLRQLQEQGEGLGEGAQAVMRGLDNPAHFQPRILGVLGDRIRVSPEFLPAIEAALGASQQAILLADSETLRDALAVLRRDRLGRAVLARAPRDFSAPGQRPAPPAGSLGWAADHVGGEPEARALAATLLENVVLAPDFESAAAIRAENPALAVATLSGEFFDTAGLVAGGMAGDGQPQSALARRARIEELEAGLAAAISRLEACAASRASALASLDSAQDSLIAAREALQSAQVALVSHENEEKLLLRQKADLEARLVTLCRESAQITESLSAACDEIAGLERDIRESQDALERLRTQRSSAETGLHEAREREAAAAEALNEIRVVVATGRQQQQHLAGRRTPMESRLAELSDLMESRRREIGELAARVSRIEEENAGLAASLESLAQERTAAEARSAALAAARDDLRAQAEALETALREARGRLTQIQDERSALELRAAQLEMRRENIRNHVSQRYHLDLEAFEPDTYALLVAVRERSKRLAAAADDAPEASAGGEPPSPEPEPPAKGPAEGSPVPWERVEALVADLTERIESMGPVNLEAIQEFEELEQRQLFLEKQNADLVNSKVELLEVISKINRTTRELFSGTFSKIRDNFRVMFAELFGGGHANLELLDESDPLESGIEIVARPPGKQLKSVSLLSGGERTMTAVALLFAIYMVKPSPCLLYTS
ncbi:MAG: chromosome segregation protein SMC, partial [Terrimicrobiaceae bacterium]|nr:chromosome segregation protein SMC [Terrimicrobiaceae bacterium]